MEVIANKKRFQRLQKQSSRILGRPDLEAPEAELVLLHIVSLVPRLKGGRPVVG